MISSFNNFLLDICDASACEEEKIIQSLWSGYGKISRYRLQGASRSTVVVKHIALTQSAEHPRGWNTDNSHFRKVRSYEVETHWYRHWNQGCIEACRTPQFIGSYAKGDDQWIVLEDLDSEYPLRKHELSFSEVKGCLQWLAHFHASFLSQKPSGLWEVGTYWHLQTRPDELAKMEHEALKSKAHVIDELLNQCRYQTIVHGDAKLANFCFSKDGERIAALDFQYVGGGCGVKDVAYFLGSCLSSADCNLYQDELLNFYFSAFRKAHESSEVTIDIQALEQEWRAMYPIACADFTRFLLGWMPTHHKVNDYHLSITNEVLRSL